jgi:hypothetical protein
VGESSTCSHKQIAEQERLRLNSLVYPITRGVCLVTYAVYLMPAWSKNTRKQSKLQMKSVSSKTPKLCKAPTQPSNDIRPFATQNAMLCKFCLQSFPSLS